MYSGAIALLVNIILNYIFIKTIGFKGPAWASLGSIAIMALYQLYYSLKNTEMKLSDIFDIKNMILIIAVNIFIFTTLHFLKLNLEISNLLINMSFYAMLYALCIIVL